MKQTYSENTALLGFCETDITPDYPVRTIGFGREDEMSRGVLAPLKAQAALWQLGKERCVLVTIDHIGFGTEHATKLRGDIGRLIGTGEDKVMLCFSHTHSAPNDSIEDAWREFADRRIKDAVRKAATGLSPVLAAWGNGRTGIGVNRRIERDEMDSRIGIIRAADENDRNRLLILRLTAHANVLKADNFLISPDYFGEVRSLLQEKYGCPVMVTQGASGNAAPKYFSSAINPPDADDPDRYIRTDRALLCMAQEVLHSVDEVIGTLECRPVTRLGMYCVKESFDASVPDMERAEAVAAEAKEYAGIDGTHWLREVKRLHSEGIVKQQETVTLQYFVLNDGCFCGVPNEIMCEFALKACRRLGSSHFYLGGYTNGCTGYWPGEEEYDKGGYEVFWSMLIYYVYYGRVFPLDRDSAQVLIRTAAEHAPGELS
ncbi:hypothetical protein [Anaerolentibacter hominis]|uniref:hypothetical protein n=1 Tax=Anaerolentibacter hominis TaxID=3079009 RepID=UPI0031B894DF